LCLRHSEAAYSVHSPPPPNPGLPGFGHFKTCRKRASPQPAGEGLGVGVRQRITARPPPRRFAPTLPTRGRVGPSSPFVLIPFHRNAFSHKCVLNQHGDRLEGAIAVRSSRF